MYSEIPMKVSELARAAGVSADTVRFYTREGLLHPARDPNNGYQRYATADLQRLRFARKARQLGFSLKEVTGILRDADRQRSPCPQVRDLFARKLADVEQQLVELTALRDRMRAATAQWQAMPDGAPDGHTICRLIEHWDDGECCATTDQNAQEISS
jgi:MerR family transcriptional regulator, Zn(II)-responsive regulator of zntA